MRNAEVATGGELQQQNDGGQPDRRGQGQHRSRSDGHRVRTQYHEDAHKPDEERKQAAGAYRLPEKEERAPRVAKSGVVKAIAVKTESGRSEIAKNADVIAASFRIALAPWASQSPLPASVRSAGAISGASTSRLKRLRKNRISNGWMSSARYRTITESETWTRALSAMNAAAIATGGIRPAAHA